MAKRRAALFVFVTHISGMHVAAWRDPDAAPDPGMNFEYIKSAVQAAKRGKLHGFFMVDNLAKWSQHSDEIYARTAMGVGLLMTGNTTLNEPYHLARKFA